MRACYLAHSYPLFILNAWIWQVAGVNGRRNAGAAALLREGGAQICWRKGTPQPLII